MTARRLVFAGYTHASILETRRPLPPRVKAHTTITATLCGCPDPHVELWATRPGDTPVTPGVQADLDTAPPADPNQLHLFNGAA